MKKFLCVVLTLSLVLASLAGCGGKDDPQSESESSSQPESSSQAVPPEPIMPEPIMPVPEQDPEPEPEDDPEPEEDETPAEDEDDEEGDEEGEEDEEDEDDEDNDGLDELGTPAVPHGEDIEWLDFTTVTEEELKPLLDKVLARAEYFCRYGLTSRFTEAKPDKRKEAAIVRPYRTYDKWTYYPYTDLPYHTVEELQEAMLSVFTWEVVTSDMYLDLLTDDGERLYYADEVFGYSKARGWDTSRMKIRDADEKRLTLRMPTHWGNDDFDADLTLRIVDGYLVLDNSYFAVTEEDREKRVIK